MRKILLKQVTDEISYASWICEQLAIPENGQFSTVEEMMRTVPVIEKFKELKAGADYILLEDAEYEEVLKRTMNAKFGANSQDALDLVLAVQNAEKVQIELAKTGD